MIVTVGLGSQQLVLRGYGDFGTHKHTTVSVPVVTVVTWPFVELLPMNFFTLEGAPTDGYTLEPPPVLPSVQDGLWTEPGVDGFYDEYPLDGFYAKEGYDPEPKPLRRATPTQESGPVATFTSEGKPN